MTEMQDKIPITANEVLNVELSNKCFTDFLNLYKNMASNISETNFCKFLEIIHNENMTFSKEETVNLFRTNLIEQLTESFQKFWRVQQMPISISVLELLKDRFKNRTISQWRPQNQSPSEQTLPNRIRFLKRKQNYLNKHWDFQKPMLQATVLEIGKHRKRIEKSIARREVLSYRIDEQTEKLQILQKKIFNAQLEAVKLL